MEMMVKPGGQQEWDGGEQKVPNIDVQDSEQIAGLQEFKSGERAKRVQKKEHFGLSFFFPPFLLVVVLCLELSLIFEDW